MLFNGEDPPIYCSYLTILNLGRVETPPIYPAFLNLNIKNHQVKH